ncbi:MAG: hypothetical protein JST33_06290 [Actinobacteria bacterium]|nr:hypothetical protein [Actinomycetota bacterium]
MNVIDLAPTLLDFAGISGTEHVHGNSVGDAIVSGGETAGWRTQYG